MFTGLIEQLGTIQSIIQKGSNIQLEIEQSQIIHELKIDESIAHNGICLTVEMINEHSYQVTAIEETIQKTTIANWRKGEKLNIERAIRLSDRLGGHIVQGHVDGIGECKSIISRDGSTIFSFSFPSYFAKLVIEKGSICVNGTSLTAFDVRNDQFSVAIIPFTLEHTVFQFFKEGDQVNLEFDILGKYILRDLEVRSNL